MIKNWLRQVFDLEIGIEKIKGKGKFNMNKWNCTRGISKGQENNLTVYF